MGKKPYEPFVSIIVPTLNSEETIKDLLDSLTSLDYRKDRLEIIIVDGGSTDRTVEIAKKYPVKIIEEKRKGINVARNAGVKASKGEILVFTDSDCVVPKDWIRKIVDNFRDNRIGCLGGNALRHEDHFLSRYGDMSIIPVLRVFKKRELLDDVKFLLKYPAGCNMAFRRESIERAGFFNEAIRHGFDEDELVERVCKLGYKMLLDPEVIVWHKHRKNLRGLLKQFFNYGRGGGSLVKMKIKGKFSQWMLLIFFSFLTWLILTIVLTLLSVILSKIFLIPLLLITAAPLASLTIFYIVKAARELGLKYCIESITYPLIDFLRLISFNLGIVYGLLSPSRQKLLVSSPSRR